MAYDWSGHETGTIRVTAFEPFGALQSPDGTAIVLLHARPASGGTVIGRARGSVVWADDSAYLCAFRTESGGVYLPTMMPATPPAPPGAFIGLGAKGALFLDDPRAGKSRLVARFGVFGDHGGPAVLACTVTGDRAVVGTTFGDVVVAAVHAVRLSDGSPVGASGFAAQPTAGLMATLASPDGRLVALGSTSGVWSSADNHFVIRDVDSGATLATVDGGIVAFSDDNNRVLTVTHIDNSNERELYRLVDWHTGRVVWSSEFLASTILRRPGTGDLLVQPWNYRPIPGTKNTRQPFTSPIVVHADGTVSPLPTEVRPLDY
ncbi:MAG TPA: hypothetical protein VI316_07355 [Candidatus Dormibacteraeota bacterium]